MSGHTDGPWRTHVSAGRGHLCVVAGPDDSFTWICGEIYNAAGDMPKAEAAANARLLAAGPDLVKALEEIDTLAVCTGVVDPAQHRNMLENIARIARAALATLTARKVG